MNQNVSASRPKWKAFMKTSKHSFGILSLVAALLQTAITANADTFIGPTSSTNHFIIGTNESILIDTVEFASIGGSGSTSLVISNVSYTSPITYPLNIMPTSLAPFAVAGPAELVFSNLSCYVHMTRLTNSSMQMIMWNKSNPTNIITVTIPAGKTFQLFDNGYYVTSESYPPISIPATLSFGTQSFQTGIANGDLIQGPVTISFNPATISVTDPQVVGAYWFVENVFQNPNAVLLTGAPQILVQKSADLQNWVPVATFSATLGSNSFYRLQISP